MIVFHQVCLAMLDRLFLSNSSLTCPFFLLFPKSIRLFFVTTSEPRFHLIPLLFLPEMDYPRSSNYFIFAVVPRPPYFSVACSFTSFTVSLSPLLFYILLLSFSLRFWPTFFPLTFFFLRFPFHLLPCSSLLFISIHISSYTSLSTLYLFPQILQLLLFSSTIHPFFILILLYSSIYFCQKWQLHEK